jgi:hypothetical protein
LNLEKHKQINHKRIEKENKKPKIEKKLDATVKNRGREQAVIMCQLPHEFMVNHNKLPKTRTKA